MRVMSVVRGVGRHQACGTVAAAATAIGDAKPAGSAEAVNESAAVVVAATSQYLAALEESIEAMWRHMGGSVREQAASRGGDGGDEGRWGRGSSRDNEGSRGA